MVRLGLTVDEIDTHEPGYVMLNKRKIEDYNAWQAVKRARRDRSAWPGVCLDRMDPDSATYKIAEWILDNIKTEQPRPFKQKQLYIWSSGPNVGKTHLVNELEKYLVVYQLPKTKFVCGYESLKYDLVVCDEFNADFTITFLNEFVQGSKMHLNQKGGGAINIDNPPVIILSNKSPELAYHKAFAQGNLSTFLARFTVVEVRAGEKIDVFQTLCKGASK